jgi:hypothetical protein
MSNILPVENGVKIYRARFCKSILSYLEDKPRRGGYYYFIFEFPKKWRGWFCEADPHLHVRHGWLNRKDKQVLSFYDFKRRGFFRVVEQ